MQCSHANRRSYRYLDSVGTSYECDKYNEVHLVVLNNVSPERGLAEGDILQNNTRNEGKYVDEVYSGRSKINKLYIQHLVSRV
jgi:hypothetical protein